MLVDLTTVSRSWAVVSVKPRLEGTSEALLNREGFSTYCPRFKRRPSEPGSKPLFPGYIFSLLSPALDLAKLRNLPGVQRPLIFKNQLACVEEERVRRWREREAGRGYLVPEQTSTYTPGQKIRVKHGIFTGFDGVVLESMPAKERVRILLDYLNSSVSLEVDSDLLK